jgi:hypothetical protein
MKMNKYLIALLAVVFAFSSCDEDAEPSLITKVAPFSITEAPSVIMTNEIDAEEITVEFKLSASQVVATAVTVSVDEENSTAVLGEDFTLSTDLIDIEAYKQGGSFAIQIIGDVLPEPQDPDIAYIKIGPADQSIVNWTVDNTVTIELQIFNDTTGSYGLRIITDWDGLLAVPSLSGTTQPVYPICANGVDLDPVFYTNDGEDYVTYSDDYGACPEEFTGIQNYPEGTYQMFVENYANPFGPFADATGDICIDVTVVRPGISFLNFEQDGSLCYIATDLGYSQGGPYELRPLLTMTRTGNSFTFTNPTDESVYGTVVRILQNPANIERWKQNMLNKPYVQPTELVRY